MFALVLIFMVSFLVLPLIELLLGENPNTVRIVKAVVIALTLIWLVVILFFAGNSAALFPIPGR